jgi:NAD(P)-dependent dehydrogenase (short-subunit alcohol dehydrogenase family)
MQNPDIRIALITGANKGIGFEIARQIGASGVRVLLGARDSGLGESAAFKLRSEGIRAEFLHVDLSKHRSIEVAAQTISEKYGVLDILVNNASITDDDDGPPSTADREAVRRIFDTNFLGTLDVTQAMLPLLRLSLAARIVNVSSGLGSISHNRNPEWDFAQVKLLGYNASKAALNMLTVQLAAELKGTNVKVNSADPGFTATDMSGHRSHQTILQGAAAAIRLALLPDDGPSGGFFSATDEEPW